MKRNERIRNLGQHMGYLPEELDKLLADKDELILSFMESIVQYLDSIHARVNRMEILITGNPDGKQAMEMLANQLAQLFQAAREAQQNRPTKVNQAVKAGLILPDHLKG